MASGDLAALTRSSSVGVTLAASHTYLHPMGQAAVTGCHIAGQGGPHLCAWDGATGAIAWSTAGPPAGLAVQYNAFGRVGNDLYFAAEVRGRGGGPDMAHRAELPGPHQLTACHAALPVARPRIGHNFLLRAPHKRAPRSPPARPSPALPPCVPPSPALPQAPGSGKSTLWVKDVSG